MRSARSLAALGLAVVLAVGSGIAHAEGGGAGAIPQSMAQDDPARAYQAGLSALQAHDYGEAIRQFRTVRRSMPRDGAVNYVLGLAYLGNADTANARRAFERASEAADAPAATWLQLGLIYIELGDRTRAQAQRDALAQLLSACDAGCGAARRAQLQAAHDQLNAVLEAQTAPSANPATTGWNFPSLEEGRLAYAEAVGHINQERYDEALDALARARAAVGPNADILNYMGFASRKVGRLDEALSFYRQALRLEPNHLGATEYLGELYLQMGDLERATSQLAQLDRLCTYGCAQREELQHWIEHAQGAR